MVEASAQPAKRVIELTDLQCSTCRYSLRGLDPDGRCPECGHSIVPSLIAYRQNRLKRPEPLKAGGRYWLTQQIEGIWLLLLSLTILLSLAVAPNSLFAWRSNSRVVMLGFVVCRVVFDWYGVWKIAAYRPELQNPGFSWLVLRAAVTYGIFFPVLLYAMPRWDPPLLLIMSLGIAMFVATGLAPMLLFAKLSSIAKRADAQMTWSLAVLLAVLMMLSSVSAWLMVSLHGPENSLDQTHGIPSPAFGTTELFHAIDRALRGYVDIVSLAFLAIPTTAVFVLIRLLPPLYRARREATT